MALQARDDTLRHGVVRPALTRFCLMLNELGGAVGGGGSARNAEVEFGPYTSVLSKATALDVAKHVQAVVTVVGDHRAVGRPLRIELREAALHVFRARRQVHNTGAVGIHHVEVVVRPAVDRSFGVSTEHDPRAVRREDRAVGGEDELSVKGSIRSVNPEPSGLTVQTW